MNKVKSLSLLSFIANSAPHINTVIIIGCIVMMATCVLLGIDSGTPQVTPGDRSNVLADINDSGKQRYASICMVRRRYIGSYFIIYCHRFVYGYLLSDSLYRLEPSLPKLGKYIEFIPTLN